MPVAVTAIVTANSDSDADSQPSRTKRRRYLGCQSLRMGWFGAVPPISPEYRLAYELPFEPFVARMPVRTPPRASSEVPGLPAQEEPSC